MKIIFDNIIFSLQKAGGISIYWYEIIKRLTKKEKEVIFYESTNENIFRKDLQIKSQKESSINLKLLRYLPFIKTLPPYSIFHSSYYRVSLQKDVLNITTVHDFTYEYFRSGLAKMIHIWQKGFAIKKSDGIVCVSENTKRDLLKFYPQIEESKIKVIYNGVGDEFIQLNNANELLNDEFKVLKDKKSILYIGDRSSYKNFEIAVEVLRQMSDYTFVIVGGQELSQKEKEGMKDMTQRVYHFRGICGEKLNILYNTSFCLLYPSSYEGFGIPVIEAMKAGCPVVSTNLSSIPEVAGDAGLLVDSISTDSLIYEIRKLKNNNFRDELIQKGFEQAKKFSWDMCFNEMYSFYQKIWEKKFEG